jgi:undecaprenyl-diphosphatase
LIDLYHAFILALVQGLTEFLPVSSSAHLILVPKLLHWPDQGLAFDVAIHVGTLFAVLAYFRTEIKLMIRDWCASLAGEPATVNSRLAWAIGFGTIPVGLAGLFCNDFIEHNLRATWVIAITTIVFGILLGIAAYVSKPKRDEHSITWKDVTVIGCAQALALIPGVSRSGITLTAGLFMGLSKQGAARYSFLLSIPVIILAGGLEAIKLTSVPVEINYPAFILGFIIAMVSGYACIGIFLRLLDRFGVMPFVVYRIVLGTFLLLVI